MKTNLPSTNENHNPTNLIHGDRVVAMQVKYGGPENDEFQGLYVATEKGQFFKGDWIEGEWFWRPYRAITSESLLVESPWGEWVRPDEAKKWNEQWV